MRAEAGWACELTGTKCACRSMSRCSCCCVRDEYARRYKPGRRSFAFRSEEFSSRLTAAGSGIMAACGYG